MVKEVEKCVCEGRLKRVQGVLAYKTPHTCSDVGKCELSKAIGDFYTQILTKSTQPVYEIYLEHQKKFKHLGLNVEFPTYEDLPNSFSQLLKVEEKGPKPVGPVPSTSGVVPKTSTTTVPSSVPSQAPVKPYVPVQSDVRPSPPPHPPVVKKPPTAPEPEPQPPPEDSSISVKWNTYATNMSSVMPSLLQDEKFVDVTLACEGKYIKCHKVILGACSVYFEELLSINPCQHPIVLLKDVQFWEIQAIIDFIYRGVVNIPQNKLPKLLEVARVLQIKGLTGAKNDTGSTIDEIKPAEDSKTSQSEVINKLRKRPKTSQISGVLPSKTPEKRMKLKRKSSIEPLESNTDESSDQSDTYNVSQLSNPAAVASPGPSSLLHMERIKEEYPQYDVDDSSHSYDHSMVKSDSSQLGQFQLLTLPASGTIKQEVSDEIFDQTDEDPLESESGVS